MYAVYFYCCCCCKVFLQKCTIACIWLLQIRREEKTTTSTVNIKWRPLVSANHSPPPHVSFCRKFLGCCFGFSQSTWRHSVAFHARLWSVISDLRDVSGRPGHQEPGYPSRQAGRYPRRCAFAKRLLHDPGRNSVQHHAWRYWCPEWGKTGIQNNLYLFLLFICFS